MLRLLSIFLLLSALSAPGLPPEIDEVLEFYCYDCHGYGKKEGEITLDDLSLAQDHGNLWELIWRNVRTGMMPPAEGDPLEPDEKKQLLDWLERNPLGIDRSDPDPGRVTMRRHNRIEYQNTVKDLLGLEFKSAEHFPPDDTGYGFDTIGDVLTISPLLAERYFETAKELMARAVPDNAASLPLLQIYAPGFVDSKNTKDTGRFIEFNRPQTVTAQRWLPEDGQYQIRLEFAVEGSDEATDQTATLVMKMDEKELSRKELGWDFQQGLTLQAKVDLKAGKHLFGLQTIAGQAAGAGQGELGVVVKRMRIEGPLNSTRMSYPASYRRVISEQNQPKSKKEWPEKMKATLRDFGSKAWRRPIADKPLQQLTELALAAADEQDSFEAGVRQAGTAILASPRFLLRSEKPLADVSGESYPLLDEWSSGLPPLLLPLVIAARRRTSQTRRRRKAARESFRTSRAHVEG